MHTRTFRASLTFVLLGLCVGSTFSLAQTTTGTLPFSTMSGGPIDSINVSNLNVHLTIPVLRKAGRGLPFSYDLYFDNSAWFKQGTQWNHSAWWGANDVVGGSVGNTSFPQVTCPDGSTGVNLSGWFYRERSNTLHSFTGVIQICGIPNQFTATTKDGSEYTLFVASDGIDITNVTVYTRSGSTIVPAGRVGTNNTSRTDSNGNQLTAATSGGITTFTDTLGLTALTLSGGTLTYTGPSNVSEQVVQTFTPKTVQTNFGCSGVTEFPATTVNLTTRISLPDGSSYQFTYEPTPGFPNSTTGRIKSVTLPTGGTINYTYTGANHGIICADGSTAGLTRQTPDGSWTYSRSGSGQAWTTTVTDPQSNTTTYKFQGNYETSRLVRDSQNNLLATVLTCYNGAASPCDTTAVSLPITRRTVTTQMPNSAGRQSKTDTFLNTYGLPTEVDTYDWATGAVGSLIQKMLTTYASLGNHISDHPQTQTVQDGSAHTLAQSTYTYDEGSVTGTTGTPQHVAITGSRGNLTTVAQLVGGTATLNTHYTYYDTGTINTITDPNSAVTTYNYSPTGSCGNSFVTSVSLPLSLSQASTWDCNGGVVTQITDANNQTGNYQYTDLFWRTTQVTDQANVPTPIAYSANSVESSVVFNGGSSTVDMLATLDSLGRSHIAQKKQSVNVGANYDSVETDYDSLGRPYRVTMPYAAAAGITNATAPAIITAYDALSRPTQVTNGGNGAVTVSYRGNDVKRTTGPAPTVSRQLEYDALGRLTSVCELTGAADKVACGQYAAANGYFTKYAYDTTTFSGNLVTRLTVTQNALSANSQTRTFLYDLLGRLLSETNPEWGPGTTTNVYDSDTTCTGGYPTGNLLKRTDAMGNITCYTYDQLHRQTDITYPTGPYASTTAPKHFVYDNATVNGGAMALAKGRLAEAYTGTSGSKITDLGFSYSSRGEVADTYQSSLNSGGYYHLNATYWEHGAVKKLMGVTPASLTGYSATYGMEGEGRPYTVTAASGQNPVTSVTYNNGAQTTQPIGALTGVALGSGDSDTFSFDPNTGRFNKYTFTVNNQSVVGTLTWNPNGSLGSLQITDPFNSADSQTCNYGSDDLGRIASANCGAAWNQTYSFDPFGNIKKTATVGTSFIPIYNLATNRYSSISGCTPALVYDGNGNLQSDCTNSFAWDAEGEPATINTLGITYDALGRAVEAHGASYTQIVYGPQGNKIALMSGQNLTKSFVPLPGGATAVYNSAGLVYYRHSDWLGSSRFASTPTAPTGKYFDVAYAPYGEDYVNSGTRDVSFTGENQDLVSGLSQVQPGPWPLGVAGPVGNGGRQSS